jgi:hypothetical protein
LGKVGTAHPFAKFYYTKDGVAHEMLSNYKYLICEEKECVATTSTTAPTTTPTAVTPQPQTGIYD